MGWLLKWMGDISILNSWILYNLSKPDGEKFDRKEYIISVLEALCEDHPTTEPSAYSITPTSHPAKPTSRPAMPTFRAAM